MSARRFSPPRAILVALPLSLMLLACGGGGGGTSVPVASTASFNLQAVQAAEFTTAATRPFTLSGTASGYAVTGSGTEVAGSVTAGTFEGLPALQRTTTVTGSVTVNGVTTPLTTSTVDWSDTHYVPVGAVGGEYVVVQGTPTLPSAAHVGDAGLVATANRYADSSKTSLQGTVRTTYGLAADTATTAILSLTQTYYDTSSAQVEVVITQYRIDTSNGFTPLRASDTDYTRNVSLLMTY